MHVAFYPQIINVSGCDPYTAGISDLYRSYGAQLPDTIATGTFSCALASGISLQVWTILGQTVAKSLTVGGKTCLIQSNTSVATADGDYTLITCKMAAVAQGLFQQVVVSAQDRTSGLFLSSAAASLVSFTLPTVVQVRLTRAGEAAGSAVACLRAACGRSSRQTRGAG